MVSIVEPRTVGFSAPMPVAADPDGAAAGVAALIACARAESCLSQADFQDLAQCSSTALECADICQTTVWSVARCTGRDTGHRVDPHAAAHLRRRLPSLRGRVHGARRPA
jgi:hypothetical protein